MSDEDVNLLFSVGALIVFLLLAALIYFYRKFQLIESMLKAKNENNDNLQRLSQRLINGNGQISSQLSNVMNNGQSNNNVFPARLNHCGHTDRLELTR